MRKLTPESSLKRLITDWLKAEKIPCFRMQSGAQVATHKGRARMIRYGEPGMADLVAMPKIHAQRTPLWIELKSLKGQLTPDQRAFGERMQELDMHYIVVRSLDALQNWCREFVDAKEAR